MDTAAFIVALAVIVAVGLWYVENEMKQSDGAHGLLAVRQAEKLKKSRLPRFAEGVDALRYRPRGGADAPPPEDRAAPKYRRKERAWDRAAKEGDEPS